MFCFLILGLLIVYFLYSLFIVLVLYRNGPEWWRIRSEVQKGVSTTQSVRGFLADTDDITLEFVHEYLPKDARFDALKYITRLNLECK